MDYINGIINEIIRQQREHTERTLAELIDKYDFLVCSTELMNKVEEMLPEGSHITYTPYIGDPAAIYAIKKYNVMDLLDKELKEKDAAKQESETVTDFADRCRECGARYGKLLKQQPKTGHWVKYSIPRCGEKHYKCTSCGYYINFGQWGEIYTKQFKYCPNCGIKMEEKEEK